MAFSFKAGAITEKATTGSQAYTGVGFQPKAIVFVFTASDSADAFIGFGVTSGAGGSDSSAICIWSQDNQGTSVTRRSTQLDESCIVGVTTSVFARALLVSFDADGFTLNWTAVSGASLQVQFYAFGGDDITNVAHLGFTSKSTTGNQAYTGVGFQPDFAFFLGAINTSAEGVATSSLLSFGAAVSTAERFACGISMVDGQDTSNTNRKQVSDRVVHFPWALSGAVLEQADLVSFDADGFTLNWDTVSGFGQETIALCFKGGQYKIGTDTAKTTTTGTKATTGVGFTPTGLMLTSVCNTSSASIVDHARLAVGGANSSTSRACHWMGDTDNGGTTVSDRDLNTTHCLRLLTEGTPTEDAAADLDTFDADGFTLDWDNVDANAYEFVYIAFGSDATGSSVSALDEGMLVGGLQTLCGGLT